MLSVTDIFLLLSAKAFQQHVQILLLLHSKITYLPSTELQFILGVSELSLARMFLVIFSTIIIHIFGQSGRKQLILQSKSCLQ